MCSAGLMTFEKLGKENRNASLGSHSVEMVGDYCRTGFEEDEVIQPDGNDGREDGSAGADVVLWQR